MLDNLARIGAEGFLGLTLLVFGIWIIDLVSPGRVPVQLSLMMSATAVAGARLLAVGIVVFAAIRAGEAETLAETELNILVYGVAGIFVQVIATWVLGLAYRGSEVVLEQVGSLRPLAVLVVAGQIASALVIAASIL